MPGQLKPIIHGRDHASDGADPIQGIVTTSPGATWEARVRAVGDLLAWWRMGDTFTFGPLVTDALQDSSGNSLHLNYDEASSTNRPTLNVPNTALGADDDGAVQFTGLTTTDGSFASGDTAVDEATTFPPNTPGLMRSFAGWIKPAFSDAAFARPAFGNWQMDVSGSQNEGWVVDVSDVLTWKVRASGGIDIGTMDAGLITVGTWYFVVGTWDGSVYRFYVNGGEADTLTSSTAPGSHGNAFRIGAADYDSGITTARHVFGGVVDEVITWSTVLAPGDILNLYTGNATPEDYVPVADGEGGFTWALPNLRVYLNGA